MRVAHTNLYLIHYELKRNQMDWGNGDRLGFIDNSPYKSHVCIKVELIKMECLGID